MEEKELGKLAEIIKTKIYNENIIRQEMFSVYADVENYNFNLNLDLDEIKLEEIENNILFGNDMNVLNQKNIRGYILSDLNVFLNEMLSFRKEYPFVDENFISKMNEEELVTFVTNYLKYHTYQENQKIKKMFLKRFEINFPEMLEEDIERLYFDAFSNLYAKVTEENHSKSI